MDYYDKEGRPISLMEWASLYRDMEYRRIGSTHIGHFWVSTVWLGLDHNYWGGPPIIFETMVFDDRNDKAIDLYMNRYATEAEALAGHTDTVNAIENLEGINHEGNHHV